MSVPPRPARSLPPVPNLEQQPKQARELLDAARAGDAVALERFRAHHPRLAGASDEAIRTAATSKMFTIDDARLVYAREHGCASWDDFARYLHRLAAGEAAEPFMEVVEAGRSGDWARVTALLGAHPDLVHARGTNGNTLLNLASSLVACPPPGTAGGDRLAPLRFLLAGGADPNQTNDRGWTPLHQAGYRNDPEMADLLLGAGARADAEAHGAGGTPLAVALFWGNREAADVLARAGIVPRNLRVAAGLGRRDLVRACFGPDGRLEVMELLVERGARVDADPYRGTPLLWAAATGRLEAARWLFDHGADVNQRATFGGPQHGAGVTALHLAAQDNRRLPLVEFFVARGADPTVEDAIYHGTPASWATHLGAREVATYLNGLTSRRGPAA